MSRDSIIRHCVTLALAGICLSASAHDSLTGESIQLYLARVAQLQKMLGSEIDNAARAQASVQLGQTLDEISELFNRDIEAHGTVQGLASSVLLSELTTRGAPLAYSGSANRFTANLRYYREALQWIASGPIAAEASFELLRKQFYEALDEDPLRPRRQSSAQLAAQTRLGEALRRDFVLPGQREEITFILAIHYMQSARAAARSGDRARFLTRARSLVAEFALAYPDSLRATTLRTLLDAAESPG